MLSKVLIIFSPALFCAGLSFAQWPCYLPLGRPDAHGMVSSVHSLHPNGQKALATGFGLGQVDNDFCVYYIESCSCTDSLSIALPGNNTCMHSDMSPNDGSLALTGYTDQTISFGTTVMLNADLTLRWVNHYVQAHPTYFHAVAFNPDGSVVCAGFETINQKNQLLAVKYSSTGQQEWAYQGNSSSSQYFQAVKIDYDGNIVMVGDQPSANGDYEIFVVKLSSTGQELWTTIYNSGSNTGSQSLEILPNNNILVCGESAGPLNGYFDFFIAGFSQNGSQTFYHRYPMHPTEGDAAFDIKWLGWGYVLLTGYAYSGPVDKMDLCVALVDTLGNIHATSFSGKNEFELAYGLDVSGQVIHVAGERINNVFKQAVYGETTLNSLGVLMQHTEDDYETITAPLGSQLPSEIGILYDLNGRVLFKGLMNLWQQQRGIFLVKGHKKIRRIIIY